MSMTSGGRIVFMKMERKIFSYSITLVFKEAGQRGRVSTSKVRIAAASIQLFDANIHEGRALLPGKFDTVNPSGCLMTLLKICA
jgi:hypothetical protein